MKKRRLGRGRESGQILVIFVLSAVAIIGMVGLVVDGGSTFAQRRAQQNAADVAALAGANSFLITNDQTQATTAAVNAAARNGFTSGANSTTVTVSFDLTQGARVTVGITALHGNYFLGAVGMPTWQVSTTATALTGFPDTAAGASPFIGSVNAFDNNGNPLPQYSDPSNPFPFGEGNGDIPNNGGDIAWTNYGTGNVQSSEVDAIIKGTLVIDKTLEFGDTLIYIGQQNMGYHNFLFDDVNTYLSGKTMPVPIVDNNGNFQGWSMFHFVSAEANSAKDIKGYFLSGFQSTSATVAICANGHCPRYLGTYVLRLVN
jgi:Flp pilus assembly protein TadG